MHIQTQVDNLDNYKKYLTVEKATHEFLQQSGYLKIELPVLSPALIPESYLEIFKTDFRYFDRRQELYLTPSPELFLKRLLAYGVGDCYYLGKSYRNNEDISRLHSYEFTMLEFYKEGADYMKIADDTLKLLQYIAEKIFGKTEVSYQGKKTSFEKWEKLSVAEAFAKYAGVTQENFEDRDKFISECAKKGYSTENFSYEDNFSQIYVHEIEPNLGTNGYPTLLYDYPREFAALAKANADGKTSQRFEFYINGIELGDCYSELTDPKEQSFRFEQEQKKRRETGKMPHNIDQGFIKALEHGLPDCAGIAVGFERLAMIFAGVATIDDLKLISIR